MAVRFRARLTGVAARHVPGLVPVREVPEVERVHEAADSAVMDADGHGRPSRGGSVKAT